MGQFDEKVVIVTGGAGGIGRAVVEAFAHEGAHVVAADRDAERLRQLAERTNSTRSLITTRELDVSDEAQVREFVAGLASDFGRVDVLDNNAAAINLVSKDHPVAELSTQVFDSMMQVNLRGAFLLSKHVLPLMVNAGSGVIINMASVSGLVGESMLTSYGISKAALIQLTRATAAQYGKAGIRCLAVAPSAVLADPDRPGRLLPVYARHSMTLHAGVPQDVAGVVVFLASDAARYMTGHVVHVDGGITAVNPITAELRADPPDLAHRETR